MKKVLFSAVMMALLAGNVRAQQADNAHASATSTNDQPKATHGIADVLRVYYQLEIDLVAGSPVQAAAHADTLVQTIGAVNMNDFQGQAMTAFMDGQQKLTASAKSIGKSVDLQQQRAAFASLSTDIWALLQKVKPADTKAYLLYCPMRKASWVSNTPTVQNPYYGKQMLSCGKVTESIL